MAAPQITITLSGNGSVTLRAPQPEIEAPVTVPGVVYRTQGGAMVQYQIGPAYWECTLTIPSLNNMEKNSLEAFFRSNWGGTMTYVDENGASFNVRFLDTGLPLHKTQRDLWTARLHLSFSSILN